MAALTIRVTLDDIDPVVWRAVRISTDSTLPELHDLIQDAMGWEDRHLHVFFTGDDAYARDQQRFEMRISLDEEDDGTGVCEDGVRVGDVLTAVGDELGYEYDFGDGWGHRLVVEQVPASAEPVSPACLAGERACPPEDCGGPHGYEDTLRAVADPSDPEHEHLRGWLGDFDRDHFDLALASARIDTRRDVAELANRVHHRLPALDALLVRAPLAYHSRLIEALRSVDFDVDEIDPTVASVAMEKLAWMITRVGSDGVALTPAGYLPPKFVVAMRDELDWGTEWIGHSTREIDNLPAQYLRTAAVQLGVVRVLKGRLLLTRDGAKCADDPVRLWRQAAKRLPVGREEYEKQAGVILLATIAAGSSTAERNSTIFESMDILGWRVNRSRRDQMQYLARPTLDVLRLIGAIPTAFDPAGVYPVWGRAFAVHCLSR